MNPYLTRRQSIIAASSILLLFFVAVVALKPSTKKSSKTSGSIGIDPVSAEFTLDNFQREEIKEGKKAWEIKADKGRYNPSTGKSILQKTQMILYKKDGGTVELQADNAELMLEGTTGLKEADFSGNVVIIQNKTTTIETDRAIYNRLEGMVRSPGPVKVTGDKIILEGIGMEVEVESKLVKILEQTKTLIEPK